MSRSGSSWAVEVKKRLARAKEGLTRQVYLSHCSIIDSLFPVEVFTLRNLVRLDLGFNNLQSLDSKIGELRSLQDLWLNDNPLEAMPVSVSRLTQLRALDLRNTLVRNLPREYAMLSNLEDLNLQGAPLKKSISDAYAAGRDTLFDYLRRKHERRMFKKDFERLLREDIYPFDNHAALHEMAEEIFAMLKECTSDDLSKLVRHCKRILPKVFADVNPADVKERVKDLNKEEDDRNAVGEIQLRLRAIFPEMPLDRAHDEAAELQEKFKPAQLRDIFRHPAKVFPAEYLDVNVEGVYEKYLEMLVERADADLRRRIHVVYKEASEEQVEMFLDQLLLAAEDDRSMVSRCLEASLPATLEECLALLDGIQDGEVMPLAEPSPVLEETLQAGVAQGDAGEDAGSRSPSPAP